VFWGGSGLGGGWWGCLGGGGGGGGVGRGEGGGGVGGFFSFLCYFLKIQVLVFLLVLVAVSRF